MKYHKKKIFESCNVSKNVKSCVRKFIEISKYVSSNETNHKFLTLSIISQVTLGKRKIPSSFLKNSRFSRIFSSKSSFSKWKCAVVKEGKKASCILKKIQIRMKKTGKVGYFLEKIYNFFNNCSLENFFRKIHSFWQSIR